MRVGCTLMLTALAIGASTPAIAKKSQSSADKMLDALVECQSISDVTQRLVCFDTRVNELKVARVRDKSFLASHDERQQFTPIDATAANIAEVGEGQWLLVLSDGSIWRTTEAIRFEPKKGDKVHVAKGALGAYLANIAKERAIRVRPLR